MFDQKRDAAKGRQGMQTLRCWLLGTGSQRVQLHKLVQQTTFPQTHFLLDCVFLHLVTTSAIVFVADVTSPLSGLSGATRQEES